LLFPQAKSRAEPIAIAEKRTFFVLRWRAGVAVGIRKSALVGMCFQLGLVDLKFG
jgi:hypothetical protein